MPGCSPRAARGFSLVEILVVITLIGLLATFGFNAMQNAMEKGRVTKCQDNLRQIGTNLRVYKADNRGRWPRESGIRFLLTLHRDKRITGRGSDVFVCPGTPNVFNDIGGEPGSSYDEWESIGSDTISYAGRDVQGHPLLGSNEEDQVLAADDNEYGPNHRTVTNILYADGSVVPFDLYIDGRAHLDPDEYEDIGLPVGPESPYEPLQVLRVD